MITLYLAATESKTLCALLLIYPDRSTLPVLRELTCKLLIHTQFSHIPPGGVRIHFPPDVDVTIKTHLSLNWCVT